VLAQLEDSSGLVAALEFPLPLVLRRQRRQGMMLRMKAVAFAAVVRRRRAREKRRRLLQRQFAAKSAPKADADDAAARAADETRRGTEGAARSRYEAAASLRRDLAQWEMDTDEGEFGKNAAAHIIQSAFVRFVARKRAAAAALAASIADVKGRVRGGAARMRERDGR